MPANETGAGGASDRGERLRAAYLAATNAAEESRESILEVHCRGDSALRAEVESLLRHGASGGATLEQWSPATGLVRAALQAAHPQTIGSYTILSVLGEGGFGIVYLAEQHVPVRRKVALKLLSAHTLALARDPAGIIARFQAERQTLALLDHPGIATLLDAGTTEEGRPYFVMEHVSGAPITRFATENRLPHRERLELFARVCDTVQHAHQRGIIHRDLKPANILVRMVDGRPHPKVIDFGIAKALDDSGARGPMTEQGVLLGTPGYMSPEQAEGARRGVDTRSDIYSLGAVLYELLTGSPPIDAEALRQTPLAHVYRFLHEAKVPTPSARVLATRALPASDGLPQGRERARMLRGDLNWITMKALEKACDRRYASAAEFAADIRRYLAHEAVAAGPPSAIYRLGKFVRRHRFGVASAAVLALALGAGLGVSLRFMLLYQDQARTNQVLLDKMVQAANERGGHYFNSGRYEEAAWLYRFVQEGYETSRGPLHPMTLEARLNVGQAMGFDGRLEDSAAEMEAVLDQALRTMGESWITRTARVHLGSALIGLGRLVRAEAVLLENRSLIEPGMDHSGLNDTQLKRLVEAYRSRGWSADAARIRALLLPDPAPEGDPAGP